MPPDERAGCAVSGKPTEILLVEDNPDDAALTMETLQTGRLHSHVTLAEDGVVAMDFLRKKGAFADAPRPDLILLDLQLPRKNGREVLIEVKADHDLKRIPVVIMTTSTAEQDVFESYDLHANCYLTKPFELDEFIDVVRRIEEFWLTIPSTSW